MPEPTRYRVDAALTITEVGGGWEEFAAANGVTHLAAENVVGKPLLGFVSDETTRFLYLVLFDRARACQETLRVPFRCDSPASRRRMTLAIAPGEAGSLSLEASLDEEEPRRYLPLLDPLAPRGDGFIRMCSWCKRVQAADDIWLEVEDAVVFHGLFYSARPPLVSHGICPACVATLHQPA